MIAPMVAGFLLLISTSTKVNAADQAQGQLKAESAFGNPDGAYVEDGLDATPTSLVAKSSIYRMKLDHFERFLNKLNPAEGGLENRKVLERFLANEELQVIEKLQLLLRLNKPTTSESINELIYFVGKDPKTGESLYETRNIGVTFEVALKEDLDAITLALAIQRVAFEPSEEAHYQTEVGAYSMAPLFYTNRLITTVRAQPGDLLFLGTLRPGIPKQDSIDIVVLRVGKRTD